MKISKQMIASFVQEAAALLKTSRRFSNIYQQMMTQNKKNVYAEYFNLNNRIKRYKYSKMDQNVNYF